MTQVMTETFCGAPLRGRGFSPCGHYFVWAQPPAASQKISPCFHIDEPIRFAHSREFGKVAVVHEWLTRMQVRGRARADPQDLARGDLFSVVDFPDNIAAR